MGSSHFVGNNSNTRTHSSGTTNNVICNIFFFCHQGKFTRTVPRTTKKMQDARIMRKILSFLLTKSLWSESLAKESLCSQLQEGVE